MTGASRGIGAAIARRLAVDGYAVACAATSVANAVGVADEIAGDGARRAMPIEIHVQDADSVERGVDAIEDVLGPITLLVNNAGINRVAPVHEQSVEDFDAVLDVNLRGVFICSHFVSRKMVGAGSPGSIVNIGSVAGIDGFPGRSAYGAAKAGVLGLTRSQAEAWSSRGVTVNCVIPGFVRTAMTERLFVEQPERAEALAARTMIGRNGRPDDFAGVAVFLCSDAAAFVTGQVLAVDGGFSAT